MNLQLIIFVCLIIIGYIIGRINETRHFRSIRQREAELANVLAFSERFPPVSERGKTPAMVGGNVVIAVDYFKVVSAALRNFVGGRVGAYEPLLERARREAILRMKAEAHRQGATLICNVKLATTAMGKGPRNRIHCAEVYVYGTAMVPAST